MRLEPWRAKVEDLEPSDVLSPIAAGLSSCRAPIKAIVGCQGAIRAPDWVYRSRGRFLSLSLVATRRLSSSY